MMDTIRACRSCGHAELETILDLGTMPLANALLDRADQEEHAFPLTLAFCPSCSLVQILETVDPDLLFGHYLYFTSFSETRLAQSAAFVEDVIERRGLDGDSLVVEVASNDGYLLQYFGPRGIPVLGIEPAANIAAVAEKAGIPTRCLFFGREAAESLRDEGVRANLLVGNNVLAHVAELDGFVTGTARLLTDDGCATFEVPYVREMIDKTEFDTIYHEHLCYFSLHALVALFEARGLRVTDVDRLADRHGGSLRVWCEPEAAGVEPAPAVIRLLAEEREVGLTEADYYRSFARAVEQLRVDLIAELTRRRNAGQTLAAYGASAKGSTLMNYMGIGAETLAFIADRSTVKQGRFAPGNRLPIVPPETLAERQPDAVLMLSWNYVNEVMHQQADYVSAGGEFIVPVPHVHSVGQEVLA